MEFLPLFHNLRGARVLVVGGGEIALRKSRLLADAGAVLRVAAPQIGTELRGLIDSSGGEQILRGYDESDRNGCVLIIPATDDEPLNAQVSADARQRGMPVNVVDAPALCSVIFPAIVDRSPLVIAVSSGGDAPVLARLIRAKLETWIPSTYGQLAGLAAGVLKLPDLFGPLGSNIHGQVLLGSLLSGLGAYFSVRFLTRYFENRSLRPFGIYCLVVGLACFVWFLVR